MMSLAIVIPFFKIDFFDLTIRSLANQTNQNFFLYIGNDNSPDDPLNILNKYFSPERYFYFNYKTNLGGESLVNAWNRLLNEVDDSIEWVQILGDDDYLSNNFVDCFLSKMSLFKNLNIVKVKSIVIDNDSNILFDYSNGHQSKYYSSIELLFKKINGNFNSSLSEHIFRMKSLYKYGFKNYPLGWHSDDYLILKLSNYKLIYYISESNVFVREYSGSISGGKNNGDLKIAATKLFYLDIFNDMLKIELDDNNKILFIKFIYKHIKNHSKFILFYKCLNVFGVLTFLRLIYCILKEKLEIIISKL